MSTTSAMGTIQCTASLNGGPELPCAFNVETEMLHVRSASASKPDPSWEHVDAAGHFHAYDLDGKLPTLEARHEDMVCNDDDCCDGDEYTIITMHCVLCGEEVEPRRIPDAEQRFIPGRVSYELTLHDEIPDGRFSVRVFTRAGEWFGIGDGRLDSVRATLGSVSRTYRVWCGPMGRRNIPKLAKAEATI
jgi:hypothetical protein